MNKYCSVIISLVALTFSVISLFVFHCPKYCIPDLVLTLLGACATIIVGISVVNSLELLQISRSLKEIEKIRKEVDTTKKEMEGMRDHANLALHISYGVAFLTWEPKKAIEECLKGIDIAMRLGDAPRAHSCLNVLEAIVSRVSKDENLQKELKKANKERIPKEIPESYKESSIFKIFKLRLEKVFETIETLID